MEINDFKEELEKLKNSNWAIHDFYNFILFIEQVVHKISEDEDLRHFSSIINELNLSKQDSKELIDLRNKVTHQFITEDEIASKREWIKGKIIPAISSYLSESKVIKFKATFGNINDKLISFGKEQNFKVEREHIISVGSMKFTPDFIITKDKLQIIIEIKKKKDENVKLIGIQQLITYLMANNSKYGILIIPEIKYEFYEQEGLNILIFDITTDFKILQDWVNSIIFTLRENKKKINFAFIKKWESINIEEFEYRRILDLVKKDIETHKTITKSTLKEILTWKSPRTKGKVDWNNYKEYLDKLNRILNLSEEEKINTILNLAGIGVSVGSTILHFIYPNKFPIVDFRTVRALQHERYLDKTKSVSFYSGTAKGYKIYKSVILTIKKKYKRWSLRQIDKALFAYHKIELYKKELRNHN